jgi:hypothetical protein
MACQAQIFKEGVARKKDEAIFCYKMGFLMTLCLVGCFGLPHFVNRISIKGPNQRGAYSTSNHTLWKGWSIKCLVTIISTSNFTPTIAPNYWDSANKNHKE